MQLATFVVSIAIAIGSLCTTARASVISDWQTCNPTTDTCASSGYTCCIAAADCSTRKSTCRPNSSSQCATCGAIPNWQTCRSGDTCANSWTCCIAPADCSTKKMTCRPGGSECSTCAAKAPIPNWQTCQSGDVCASSWTCCVAPSDCSTKKTTCRPGGSECSSCTGTPPTGNVIGYYRWAWSSSTSAAPSNLNLAVAFSGEVDVTTALSKSSSLLSNLNGVKYLSLGGGNAAGRWTGQAITKLNNAIAAGQLGAYKGICYDIEEGDAGLSQLFATSFATAKQYGFKVLVTISHSAPYGVSDARTLMLSFFPNANIDYISPQLYTGGEEAQNDYTAYNVAWSEYKQSRALIVPSIVQASYYGSAQTYFSSQGVTLSGFVQWKN